MLLTFVHGGGAVGSPPNVLCGKCWSVSTQSARPKTHDDLFCFLAVQGTR